MATAELILDAHAALAEGPVWLESANELMWVDCAAGNVHWLDYGTGDDRVLNVGAQVGVALPARSGFVLALPEGIARLAAGATVPEPIVRFGHESDMCLNDGACDRQGRLWVGSISFDEAPERGSLYRVDPDLQFERVLDRLWISNGIDWSLDDTKMYFVDSPTRRVDVLDYDIATGAATNRRPFHEFADDVPGIPDGLCVDAEGGLWVALWGGLAGGRADAGRATAHARRRARRARSRRARSAGRICRRCSSRAPPGTSHPRCSRRSRTRAACSRRTSASRGACRRRSPGRRG